MTEPVDHLIHARWLITCEDNNQILENHTIAIKNDLIYDLLPTHDALKKYTSSDVHSYPSHVITPGFINTHTHLAMNLLRGKADDLAVMDWLQNHIWPAEGKWVSPEFVYDGSLLAIGELIRSGTTCFNNMYFYENATANAVELAGIRAHLSMHVIDVPTAYAKTPEENFAKELAFYDQFKNHPLITPVVSPHSTYTVSVENLAKCHQIAKDRNLKINIHLQESATEIEGALQRYNKRPLQILDDIGMIDNDLIAIHMTQLNDNDFKILERTQPNIVHCPESNMKVALGLCPVQRLHNMGINVALGTDGAASNNDLDMIGEMRSAAFLGKIAAFDPTAVSAELALKMATLHGAKALGIDHRTGSLTKGKSADFIAIDMDRLETQPLYHIVSQIVYAACRSQIRDTWVAGRQLMKDRQLLTVDEKELLQKALYWREKIV